MAKRKPRTNGCKKGWVPMEIKIGKKKATVCVRFPKITAKKGKRDAMDWVSGTGGALDVIGAIVHGLAHSH